MSIIGIDNTDDAIFIFTVAAAVVFHDIIVYIRIYSFVILFATSFVGNSDGGTQE